MAKTAATAAAAEDLKHNAVVHNFAEGYDGRGGEINAVHIAHHAFINHRRCVNVHRAHRLHGQVLVIFHLVEGGHINAVNLDNLLQKGLASARLTGALPRFISFHNLRHHLFALTNNSEVKEICQGLGVIHTGAAHDNQRVLLRALRCQNRHTAQVQHVQNIGITQLVLQGKAHNIAFLERFFRFQSAQGNVALTHLGFHINPRSIHALSLHTLLLIKQMIQNFKAQIAHAHLVNIGEGQANRGLNLVSRLNDAGEFAAGIARRLLHAA